MIPIHDRPLIDLFGFVIFPNIHLPEFVQVSVRKHEKKKWMRESYHKRIQKKWDKRFGFTSQRQIIQTGDVIYAHPNTVKAIEHQFKKEGLL